MCTTTTIVRATTSTPCVGSGFPSFYDSNPPIKRADWDLTAAFKSSPSAFFVPTFAPHTMYAAFYVHSPALLVLPPCTRRSASRRPRPISSRSPFRRTFCYRAIPRPVVHICSSSSVSRPPFLAVCPDVPMSCYQVSRRPYQSFGLFPYSHQKIPAGAGIF